MEDNYTKDKPWSFGNSKNIKKHNPNLKNEEIGNFLAKNEIYTSSDTAEIKNEFLGRMMVPQKYSR